MSIFSYEPNAVLPNIWTNSNLNQTMFFNKIGPKCTLNCKKSDLNRRGKKICLSCCLTVITASSNPSWKQAIFSIIPPDFGQNQTFECKIQPFSDHFPQKSPISDQSPRKLDHLGTLLMLELMSYALTSTPIVLLTVQTLSFWDFSLISTMPSVISYLTKVNMASNITDIGNPSCFWSIIVLIKGCFRSMVLFGQLLCWSKVFFDPWLFSIKSCLLSKVLSYIWGHVPSKIVFCWSKVNS